MLEAETLEDSIAQPRGANDIVNRIHERAVRESKPPVRRGADHAPQSAGAARVSACERACARGAGACAARANALAHG